MPCWDIRWRSISAISGVVYFRVLLFSRYTRDASNPSDWCDVIVVTQYPENVRQHRITYLANQQCQSSGYPTPTKIQGYGKPENATGFPTASDSPGVNDREWYCGPPSPVPTPKPSPIPTAHLVPTCYPNDEHLLGDPSVPVRRETAL